MLTALCSPQLPSAGKPPDDPTSGEPPQTHPKKNRLGVAIAAVAGGAVAVVGAPMVLGAAGFTGAGIAAGSVAAKMMSAAAIMNGGGVAAGSLVATLQSAGAAGLSMSSNVILGSVGSALGGWLWREKKPSHEPTTEEDDGDDRDGAGSPQDPGAVVPR
ncbi:interferon alpha-inducible protein 27-like protein 2A [Talpa occidentalis]|uniref:interferon alpha-inducible protein 27-like protein 2A n=1 Tax=Talpa occidentalis TaxID=50954 RepID=UPI00188FA46C|nr:interferon alpha-inducible protein 27-like protein 2A [Talpa occidentalis]